MNWEYWVLGVITWQILKGLALIVNREVIRFREKQFLKAIKIDFPDNSHISLIAIASSDKRATEKLKRQVREQIGLPPEDPPKPPPYKTGGGTRY